MDVGHLCRWCSHADIIHLLFLNDPYTNLQALQPRSSRLRMARLENTRTGFSLLA